MYNVCIRWWRVHWVQYSLGVFSPARSPPPLRRKLFWAQCNHTYLSIADLPRIRRGPRWFRGGILSCLYKWMEQVSTGNRFLTVYPPRTTADPLTWVVAAGCKLWILFIESPLYGGLVEWKNIDCTIFYANYKASPINRHENIIFLWSCDHVRLKQVCKPSENSKRFVSGWDFANNLF